MGKHEFFERTEALGLALSFSDVRLRTGYSNVPPSEVSLETYFSRRIPLAIPFVSAAMDTVTEFRMAIALAKFGGLGIIHRGLSPEDQAAQVARVKFHLHGLIAHPITVRDDETIGQILKRRDEKGYQFHTFPVVDQEGRLVGVLTRNDFDFCSNHDLPARDVMSTELVTGVEGTSLAAAYDQMRMSKKKLLPLTDRDGKLAGMYVFSDVARIRSGNSSTYNVDERGQLRVGAAVGTGEDAFRRIDLGMKHGLDVAVIDTAHGDSEAVLQTIRDLKKVSRYAGIDIVAGNISEGASAKRLVDAGADGIKVGQGPGSICTTRIIAGVGCPQLTAIYCSARAIEGSNVPVCADGGIANSGDIPVAIGAGGWSVMLGNLLAGTKETPGDPVYLHGMQVKGYRGMGSLAAMQTHQSSRERYRVASTKLVPEGIEGVVPYRGELAPVVEQLIGGLRAGMGYVGAATVSELREKANFWRISDAGLRESHPHDVTITRDAPNYRRGASDEPT